MILPFLSRIVAESRAQEANPVETSPNRKRVELHDFLSLALGAVSWPLEASVAASGPHPAMTF